RMLALCLALPESGGAYLARLGEDHFTSPRLRAAFLRLREHLDDPLEGLADADADLINVIVRLQAVDDEPATAANLEFRWMLLERDRLRRELKHAGDDGADAARTVALQRELGHLNDVIASSPPVNGPLAR
ncbi:MAG: hypothetical protein H0V25_06330, partial [Solirubrobacterales bacterium]|nr:hypothetical protein [Solirubrobacterales bacterium]